MKKQWDGSAIENLGGDKEKNLGPVKIRIYGFCTRTIDVKDSFGKPLFAITAERSEIPVERNNRISMPVIREQKQNGMLDINILGDYVLVSFFPDTPGAALHAVIDSPDAAKEFISEFRG